MIFGINVNISAWKMYMRQVEYKYKEIKEV
jgi:hypothetical protein